MVTQTQDDRGSEASLAFPTPEAGRGVWRLPTDISASAWRGDLAFPQWSPSDDHGPFIIKTITSVTENSLGHCGSFCDGHVHLTSY